MAQRKKVPCIEYIVAVIRDCRPKQNKNLPGVKSGTALHKVWEVVSVYYQEAEFRSSIERGLQTGKLTMTARVKAKRGPVKLTQLSAIPTDQNVVDSEWFCGSEGKYLVLDRKDFENDIVRRIDYGYKFNSRDDRLHMAAKCIRSIKLYVTEDGLPAQVKAVAQTNPDHDPNTLSRAQRIMQKLKAGD